MPPYIYQHKPIPRFITQLVLRRPTPGRPC